MSSFKASSEKRGFVAFVHLKIVTVDVRSISNEPEDEPPRRKEQDDRDIQLK